VQFLEGGRIWPPYSFALGWISMNKPLLCASTFSFASATTASALDAKSRAARHGAKIFDLHFPCHRRPSLGADRFAHRLIEKRGDNSPVQIARMACKGLRNNRKAHHGAVRRKHELQTQSGCIRLPAAKTTVVG
jgi:hypothetical protein